MWKEKFLNLLSQKRTQLLVVGSSSGALGLLAGAYLTNQRYQEKYAQLAASEIAEVKRHYALRNKEGVDLNSLASQYIDKVEELGYVEIHPLLEPVLDDGSPEAKQLIEQGQALAEKLGVAQEEIEKAQNIFDNKEPQVDDNFDYDTELQRRTENPEAPYVLMHDEYFEGALDFNQVSLTYYEGDNVLTDDKDEVVTEPDKTVGNENLSRFGHGSKDANIVYIRNERLSIDIEILRSDGRYAKEVLGFDELQHSHKPGLRKFRDYHE